MAIDNFLSADLDQLNPTFPTPYPIQARRTDRDVASKATCLHTRGFFGYAVWHLCREKLSVLNCPVVLSTLPHSISLEVFFQTPSILRADAAPRVALGVRHS